MAKTYISQSQFLQTKTYISRFSALIFFLILSFTIWPTLRSLLHPISPVETQAIAAKPEQLLCRKLQGGGDYCEIEGDIRIQANTSTIFILTHHDEETVSNSWTVMPYVRDTARNLTTWKLKTVNYNDKENTNILICAHSHKYPAILFSTGGNYQNYYHSFSDLMFPLYMTSYKFQRNVNFLMSEYHEWWTRKFHTALRMLTRFPVVNIDKENGLVHCYSKMVVGLKFYSDLVVGENETGVSIHSYRQLLRDSYSLERNVAMESRRRVPRLMIVSRKRTRVILNEDEIIQVAKEVGFEVVVGKEDEAANLSKFTRIVNSCDAIMGIHGAGLANMLFLPDNAVFIQLVPFGHLEYIARNYFSGPVSKMKLQYLEYEVLVKESSLRQIYSDDDPVIKDPYSVHLKGWDMIDSVYLQNQNITVDVGRFKNTLVKAMQLLLHH